MRIGNREVEIGLVLFTGISKFVFVDGLRYQLQFISIALLCWCFFIGYHLKFKRERFTNWGINTRNFMLTFGWGFPVLVVLVGAMLIVGDWMNTSVLNKNIIVPLIAYPIWGVVQQFLVMSLVAGNLKDLELFRNKQWLIILVTAVMFSLVHIPNLWLTLVTFCMGLAYSVFYLRGLNIIALGIFHGWLGAFFYYCILGNDIWEKICGSLV